MARTAKLPAKVVIYNGIPFRRYPRRLYYTGWNGRDKVSLHREVYMREVGPIPTGWHVHHIDRDHDNNAISNLVALPPSSHHEAHAHDDRGMDRTCGSCGRDYHAGKTWGRWCSAACKERARRASGVDRVARLCTVCGAGFTVEREATTRTCSRECAESLRYAGVRSCLECGTAFLAKRRWAVYCSGRCRGVVGRRTRRGLEPHGSRPE